MSWWNLPDSTTVIRDRARARATPQPSLIGALRNLMSILSAPYEKHFQRAPTTRELVYAISFELAGDPSLYTSDATDLNYIQITS